MRITTNFCTLCLEKHKAKYLDILKFMKMNIPKLHEPLVFQLALKIKKKGIASGIAK